MKAQLFARCSLAVLALAMGAAHANLAEPDPTWDGDGTLTVQTGLCNEFTTTECTTTRDVLPLADGRVLLLADDYRVIGHGFPNVATRTRLVRRLADGQVDATYRNGGADPLPNHGGSGHFSSMAAAPDGGIYVVSVEPAASQLSVTRLTADGSVDPTYGVGGNALGPTITGFIYEGFGRGFAVQADGALVISFGDRVCRLTPAGILDVTYGGPNCVALPSPPFQGFTGSASNAVRIDAQGRAVVMQTSGLPQVARISSSGTVEVMFPLLVNLNPGNTFSPIPSTLFPLADGRILVGGASIQPNGGVLARYLPDGTPDTQLGPLGFKVYTDVGVVDELTVDANGRYVGLGRVPGSVTVMRWFENGDFDASLRGGHPNTREAGRPHSLSLLPGGKMLFATYGGTAETVARYGGLLDVANDNGLFVRQQYLDFLGRPPDAAGLAFWTQRLDAGGISRAELVEVFFGSAEFQDTFAPVIRLYLATFLRFPDEAGLAFWAGAYRGGQPLEQIAAAFVSSAEFAARYGSLDNAGFVNRIYLNVLGRAADPDGLAFWTNMLNTGQLTRAQLMLRFSESTEFGQSVFAPVKVFMMYRGMLRRDPDPGGFDFWTSYVRAGNAARALIQQFLDSAEYQARFLP